MKPTTHRYFFEPPCGTVVQVALPPPSPPDYADVRAFRYDDVVVGFVRYPAVTEEEERISIPLQTMCGAIFDAILFHIVETVSGTKWQSLRTEMCEALNLKKTDHTLGVLERTYGDSDVIFLQEVAKEFIAKAQSDSLLSDYAIIAPAENPIANVPSAREHACCTRYAATRERKSTSDRFAAASVDHPPAFHAQGACSLWQPVGVPGADPYGAATIQPYSTAAPRAPPCSTSPVTSKFSSGLEPKAWRVSSAGASA